MNQVKLPPWAPELRPHQISAIQNVLEQYESGSKVVFMEAPTGSGKTLIAEMVRQYLDTRGIYLCSSISLQHQYMRDFPAAKLLMGRSNYPTKDYPHLYGQSFNSISCADCTKKKGDGIFTCKWCDPVKSCPYEQAKIAAAISSQVCSNTYYYLYETNHPGTLRNRGLVVIDECDTLERILMSFIEVTFSEKQIQEYNLPIPEKKTVESSWIEWAIETRRILAGLASHSDPGITADAAEIKRHNRLIRSFEDASRLTSKTNGLETGGWVYSDYDKGRITFRPIRVDRYAEQYLWSHSQRFLLMSATIISTDEMADSLGMNE